MTERQPCSARVDEPPHYLHTHPCSRKAVTAAHWGGSLRWLCRQHEKVFHKHPLSSPKLWRWSENA